MHEDTNLSFAFIKIWSKLAFAFQVVVAMAAKRGTKVAIVVVPERCKRKFQSIVGFSIFVCIFAAPLLIFLHSIT